MIDIAVAWDAQLQRFDRMSEGNDLVTTNTQQTAVIVSLLTDRLANDESPDSSSGRRGWWANMPLPMASAPPVGDLIGSRLLVEVFPKPCHLSNRKTFRI
jgi:phage gp46-like protein